MKIAVDAMGGDNAPHQVVQGAMDFVTHYETDVILVGDKASIEPLARSSPHWGRRLHCIHAPDRISMDGVPTAAVRKQTESSIVVAANLVRSGEADALVSAGNTGVTMVAALMRLGRIKGIERPAIATVVPTLRGPALVLDVGANVDARPSHLLQFAGMGSIYAEQVLGLSQPRVGLLSIGEEDNKGNELVLNTLPQLRQQKQLNVIGNVEGRDLLLGGVDVLVCDGFVGNVVLKLTEGTAEALFTLLRQSIGSDLRSRIGGALLRPALKRLWNTMDYTEYGGALLLGVSGTCVIAHGTSNAKAIFNAIRVAKESVEGGVTQLISQMSEEQVVQ